VWGGILALAALCALCACPPPVVEDPDAGKPDGSGPTGDAGKLDGSTPHGDAGKLDGSTPHGDAGKLDGSTPNADAGKPDASAPPGACYVDFSFRPTSTATSVFVVGEWNDFDRSAYRMQDDGAGNYSARVAVPTGSWGYFFLADGAEQLDPENPSAEQRNGKSCSIIVAGCRVPSVAAQPQSAQASRPSAGQGSFSAKLTVTPGWAASGSPTVEGEVRTPEGLAFPESQWRALTGAELTLDGTEATVSLTASPTASTPSG
jgi:hypothetical protein